MAIVLLCIRRAQEKDGYLSTRKIASPDGPRFPPSVSSPAGLPQTCIWRQTTHSRRRPAHSVEGGGILLFILFYFFNLFSFSLKFPLVFVHTAWCCSTYSRQLWFIVQIMGPSFALSSRLVSVCQLPQWKGVRQHGGSLSPCCFNSF